MLLKLKTFSSEVPQSIKEVNVTFTKGLVVSRTFKRAGGGGGGRDPLMPLPVTPHGPPWLVSLPGDTLQSLFVKVQTEKKFFMRQYNYHVNSTSFMYVINFSLMSI